MNPVNPAICGDDTPRRDALHQNSQLTGLDYLEVDEQDRHVLHVVFIGRLPKGMAGALAPANFSIGGGRRVRDLKVVHLELCDPADQELDDCATLTLDRVGDFSTYTLCVVESQHGRPTSRPHSAFDPRYNCLDFTFTAGCAPGADCAEPQVCPPVMHPRPPIDYLAKDYTSFRQLMLDRLAVTIPGWKEQHAPDLMLTLVELLAYEGDRLSYLQDAVATEAYLGTARQRISVRRHARLVDYILHEGCNSRAWVSLDVSEDTPAFGLDQFFFLTTIPGFADGAILSAQDLEHVAEDSYEVFEPLMEPPSLQFTRRGLLDPAGLCTRLLTPQDPAARLLRDRLKPSVREALDAWNGAGTPPTQLVDDILQELNRLVKEQSLYDEKAFAKHRQGRKMRRLLQRPSGGQTALLNHSVIAEAFQELFVPAGQVRFFKAHDRITFYTWGEVACCLPKGATSASLLDECPDIAVAITAQTQPTDTKPALVQSDPAEKVRPPKRKRKHHVNFTRCLNLQAGDYLLFEEALGPHTGIPADADPAHRHVVRLTRVEPNTDPLLGHTVLEVEWAAQDALPFPLCISATGPAPDCELIEDISVARGNILLVDHGRRVVDELNPVEVVEIQQPCEDNCRPEVQLIPAPYRPVLSRRDLTFAAPLVTGAAATTQLATDPHQALASIRLQQIPLAPPDIVSPDPLTRYRAPLLPTAFDPADVLSTAPLAKQFKQDAKNIPPLAAYLKAGLDQQTLDDLTAYDPDGPLPDALAEELRAVLNLALGDLHLYDPDRFPNDLLDDPTLALLAQRPLPGDLERLFNRWLLEQALPDVLAPSRRYVADWHPLPDLLEASGDETVFVVEMTDDRRALLRFGDGDLGELPEAVSRFRAFYRVGSGTRGNVGAEAICHFALRSGTISGITLRPRNPLPARGGTAPEALDTARLYAPYAIRADLQRAITAEDYATLAARDFPAELQGAAAELAWTGSWYAARVSLDPLGREQAAKKLRKQVSADLEKYRRIGHDLRVEPADYVPLDISLHVCVKPDYQRAHVLAALRETLGSRPLRIGGNGFFYPDNLRFGDGVAVSRLVAAAQAVPGVLWARVDCLQRMGEGDQGELEAGYLPIHPTEIARCDSDPGFPENGTLAFVMEGGR
jgi:predicted phage baseplate assembly protein